MKITGALLCLAAPLLVFSNQIGDVHAASSSSTTTTTDANSGFKCTPFKAIMTRAVGTAATLALDPATGKTAYKPQFELNSVNLASVSGSLKFIITETIDYDTGLDKINCARKNKVNYIDFYVFTICTPANALWWFSPLRANQYGGLPATNDNGFGEYVTFDAGLCNTEQEYCKYLFGSSSTPKLGQFVGWKDVSTDVRNPTDNAYWYSAPGSCPMRPWTAGAGGVSVAKDDACNKQYPSGLCAPGVVPDGVTCTYQYEFYGEIDVSRMVGILDSYPTYTDFCKAGKKEFVRDSNFQFVEGLDFWKDPLNKTANKERIDFMLSHYKNSSAYPNNKPLPTAATINSNNPPCYCVSPACTASSPCAWNSENVCMPCTAGSNGCSNTVDYTKCKSNPTKLNTVALPAGSTASKTTNSTTGGSTTGGSGSSKTSDGTSSSSSTSTSFAPAVVSQVSLFQIATLVSGIAVALLH